MSEFETAADVAEHAREQGLEARAEAVEIAESCIEEDKEYGYIMDGISDEVLPTTREFSRGFKFGVVVGSLLEQEYPKNR